MIGPAGTKGEEVLGPRSRGFRADYRGDRKVQKLGSRESGRNVVVEIRQKDKLKKGENRIPPAGWIC